MGHKANTVIKQNKKKKEGRNEKTTTQKIVIMTLFLVEGMVGEGRTTQPLTGRVTCSLAAA